MRFLTHVAMLFYVLIITFFGGMVIAFAINAIALPEVTYYLDLAYHTVNLRILIVSISGAIILLSFIFARIITSGQQKERTIAFENPSGRVSISLGALEDMIKRAVLRVIEVKDLKPSVRATKKGVEISCRLILRAETSIPDMTARLQELIKEKVQDTLGIEENIIVRIHIAKIISEISKSKSEKKEEPEETREELTIPFQGYK